MSECDASTRAECLERFDRLERLLESALEARVRIGRIEGAVRLGGWLLTTGVAVAAVFVALHR